MRARVGVVRLALVRCAVVLTAAAVLAGCGFSPYDLPLPGGSGASGDSYTVTAKFRDVLDLVPRSAVKVNDVTVGEVDDIWLDGFTASVRIRLDRDVRLPDNATAQIRQTSLLGEKFVSLSAPRGGQGRYGRLGAGDVIPLARTGRNVEVEEVLSALSLLLNGGGVAQLKTIDVELNKALDGRETDVRQLLRRLDTFIGELDAHKREITRAIESLDRLSASLARQRETIATTVDELPAAVTVLADQRKNLTRMLVELSKLGDVGSRVIEASKADLLANLQALAPILTELARSGDSLPKSLEVLFTYPFADSAANAVKGDYTNLQLTLNLDLEGLLSGETPPPLPLPTGLPLPTAVPTRLPTSLPTLPIRSASRPYALAGRFAAAAVHTPADLCRRRLRPTERGGPGLRPGARRAAAGWAAMITRLVRVQLVVFLALTLVGVSLAGVRYAGVGRALFGGDYDVRADFADAGGIFEGAEVTYRGVGVGRVARLAPTTSGVEIHLALREGARVPADTLAVVANRSAIGEQYLDLQPRRAGGPYLREGSRIARRDTRTPLPTTALLVDLDRLVDSVPRKDLVTVVDELGTAFQGTGGDLSRLVDAGNALVEDADANLAQTVDLIEDGRTVLDTQRASGSAIRSFASDLADLSDTLVKADPDLRTVLDQGVATANQLDGLIDENEGDVPVLLGNLVTTGQIVRARLAGVRQVLIIYPYVVRGGYTVIAPDPATGEYSAHFGLQAGLSPASCRKGYGGTRKRPPEDVAQTPANVDARCSDAGTTKRGAQNAPAPAGEGPADGGSGSRSGTVSGSGTASGSGRLPGPEGPARRCTNPRAVWSGFLTAGRPGSARSAGSNAPSEGIRGSGC